MTTDTLGYVLRMGRDMEKVWRTPALTHSPSDFGEICAHASFPPGMAHGTGMPDRIPWIWMVNFGRSTGEVKSISRLPVVPLISLHLGFCLFCLHPLSSSLCRTIVGSWVAHGKYFVESGSLTGPEADTVWPCKNAKSRKVRETRYFPMIDWFIDKSIGWYPRFFFL